MAFPVLNGAKLLSSVKSCGSELHRLIIHCVKIVSPFISLKCSTFRSNCVSSVLVLLDSLCEGMIYFCPSRYFVPGFHITFIHPSLCHPASISLSLSLSPFRRSYLLLLIVFLPALFLLWHSGDWAIIVKPRRWNSSCPRLQSCRIRQGCTEMTKEWPL